MKNILATMCLWVATSVYAQDCIIPISIQLDEEFSNVPTAARTVLYNALTRIATDGGLTSDPSMTPFVLTAHCDVLDKNNLPGPPVQTVYNLGVTLYVADTQTQKKFASTYIALNGVGTGEVKSYTNAFRGINSQNKEIKALIANGKKSMMQYYDAQYPNIIREAQRLESMQKYEEALSLTLSIPVCSKGGEEASEYSLQLYTKHLNRMNLFLLNQARAIWTAGQDGKAAHRACALLAHVDPDAACYAEATQLMKEIKGQVRSDIDFEMREKYHDAVNLERERIAAAKAVGVAYGNGQQPTTTNLMWLK